jgi:hypothetical protein
MVSMGQTGTRNGSGRIECGVWRDERVFPGFFGFAIHHGSTARTSRVCVKVWTKSNHRASHKAFRPCLTDWKEVLASIVRKEIYLTITDLRGKIPAEENLPLQTTYIIIQEGISYSTRDSQ